MNDDHDPLDETLARGLRALAPSEFELDADRALGSLRPALRHARARRRLAVSTSVVGVFVVVAAGATVLQRHPASHVNIQAHASSTVSTPPARSTTTAVPRSTTTTSVAPPPPAITPTTTPDHHTGTTTRGPIAGGGPPPAVTTPVTETPPTTRSTTTPLPASRVITYRSGGGRITITFAGGRLKLDSYAAAAGYTAEVHTDTASEIEVRFSNDTDHLQSRVRVRVKDGQLEPEIDNS